MYTQRPRDYKRPRRIQNGCRASSNYTYIIIIVRQGCIGAYTFYNLIYYVLFLYSKKHLFQKYTVNDGHLRVYYIILLLALFCFKSHFSF